MDNIVTYAGNTLDTFPARPLCSVDSLILSWTSYFPIPPACEEAFRWGSGIRVNELYRAEYFPILFHENWHPEDSRMLLTAMAASPRFRDVRIVGYTAQLDTAAEKQFSAMTFLLPDGTVYVAFRGTDMTLVGWKEDFNMAFRCPIPSQESARSYLETAAVACPGELYVGGHSKGGNLAIYAAANAGEGVRARIRRVYSHDGPGFGEEFLLSDAYRNIDGRVEKTIPQSSLVGMLLAQQETCRIVKSSGVNGIFAHNPFTWAVEGSDFCSLDELTKRASFVDRTLDRWLRTLSDRERESFVDTLFSLIESNGAESLPELRTDWQKNIPSIVQALRTLDPETRHFMLRTTKELAALGVRYLPELFLK